MIFKNEIQDKNVRRRIKGAVIRHLHGTSSRLYNVKIISKKRNIYGLSTYETKKYKVVDIKNKKQYKVVYNTPIGGNDYAKGFKTAIRVYKYKQKQSKSSKPTSNYIGDLWNNLKPKQREEFLDNNNIVDYPYKFKNMDWNDLENFEGIQDEIYEYKKELKKYYN